MSLRRRGQCSSWIDGFPRAERTCQATSAGPFSSTAVTIRSSPWDQTQDAGIDQRGWHRIATPPFDRDGAVPVAAAERVAGQRLQPFLDERLDRAEVGLSIRPVVDLLAELAAGGLQIAEAVVGVEQVGVGWVRSRLRDPHRRLRVALVADRDRGDGPTAAVFSFLSTHTSADKSARLAGTSTWPLTPAADDVGS